MAFWANPLAEEPLRQHRWFIQFNGNNSPLGLMKYAVKKVNKPSAKIGSVTHKYLNHFFHFPGRLEWNDVQVTFASIIAGDGPAGTPASALIDALVKTAGYVAPPFDENNRQTIGKFAFNDIIGSVDITQVDAGGNKIETWTLFKPFFTEIKYGDLDYSNEEIVEISCTIKYDYAKLT
jgi:hypothetical protein